MLSRKIDISGVNDGDIGQYPKIWGYSRIRYLYKKTDVSHEREKGKKIRERGRSEEKEKNIINGRGDAVARGILLKRVAVASSEMARSPVVTSPTFLRHTYNFEKTKCHNDQGRFV